jgi:hypothetical protein
MRASIRQYGSILAGSVLFSRGSQAPFGLRRLLVVVFFGIPLVCLQIVHRLCLALDNVLFPGWRRVSVEAPVFVVGVPRSGTTYLHRVLAKDQTRFTTMRMWEMVLAPSVLQRRLLLGLGGVDRALGRPVMRFFDWCQEALTGKWGGIHKIAFDEPEEDYLLLLPICACFLLILPFPFPRRLGWLAFFDRDATSDEKSRVTSFYRDCLRRHLYVVGTDRTLLSKNVSFTPLIESLAEAFPDARFVGCHRDPLATVPSQLSAMASGGDAFGNRSDHPEFVEFFLELLSYYYAHLHDVLGGLPRERCATVPMPRLTSDVGATVRSIYDCFGMSIDDAYAEVLELETEKTRNYRSKHNYDLADFGLTEEEVAARFAESAAGFGYGSGVAREAGS